MKANQITLIGVSIIVHGVIIGGAIYANKQREQRIFNTYSCMSGVTIKGKLYELTRRQDGLFAARKVLKINRNEKRKNFLYTKIIGKKYLDIKTNFDLFGNTPFLAIKEKNNLIYRDNPIKIKKNYWRYLLKKNIKTLGIATVDKSGFVKTKVYEV